MMKDPSKNGKLREVFFRHRKKCEAWCLWGIPRWNGIHEDFTSMARISPRSWISMDFIRIAYGFHWISLDFTTVLIGPGDFPEDFPWLCLNHPRVPRPDRSPGLRNPGAARGQRSTAAVPAAQRLQADAHAPVAPRMPAGGFLCCCNP